MSMFFYIKFNQMNPSSNSFLILIKLSFYNMLYETITLTRDIHT